MDTGRPLPNEDQPSSPICSPPAGAVESKKQINMTSCWYYNILQHDIHNTSKNWLYNINTYRISKYVVIIYQITLWYHPRTNHHPTGCHPGLRLLLRLRLAGLGSTDGVMRIAWFVRMKRGWHSTISPINSKQNGWNFDEIWWNFP